MTRKVSQKNVGIDLSANMDMRIASRHKSIMEVPSQKREKSLSFRLPTAGTASATLIEEPAEEEKQEAQVSKPSLFEGYTDSARRCVPHRRVR